MIKHREKSKGGEFTIQTSKGSSVVEYTLSNSVGSVLCLRCFAEGKESKIISGVLSALAEKYHPSVLVVDSCLQEVLYQKRIGEMSRYETQSKTSLYCNTITEKNLICDLWKNSFSFVNLKKNGTDYVFLKTIREQTKPFEFLCLKEEYDYIQKKHCDSVVFDILEICRTVSSVESFSHIEKCLQKKIKKYNFQESKNELVLHCTEEIIIPSIIRLGKNHQFPIKLLECFGKFLGNYHQDKEDFLSKFNSQNKY